MQKIDTNSSKRNQIIINLKDKKKFIIASIGPVSLRKGTDIFIEIAKLCEKDKSFSNFHFLWIGYLNDSDNILSNTNLPKNITFAPQTDDIYSFSKFIDCLLVCSRSEGGPIVMLESMYLKKYNISYKECGISNELLSNECGILIDDNNAEAYKNAIEQLFIEKKIFINKELAKQKIIDKYDVYKTILKLQNEFIK